MDHVFLHNLACIAQHFYLRFIQNFNHIPTTLKEQGDAVRGFGVAASVAVHVTILVPTGKEPCNWLLIVDRVIALLLGDVAVQPTFGVPQLSSAVGWLNATTIFPDDVRVMGCVGHCVNIGAVVSGTVKRGKKSEEAVILLVALSTYQ